MNVITLYPGRAAEEVERQVTIPIETALSSVPNVVRSFSHTQFGLSFLILTFNDKPTDQLVRQQVLERLRGVDLPPGVEPEMRRSPPPSARSSASACAATRFHRRSCARSRTGWSRSS